MLFVTIIEGPAKSNRDDDYDNDNKFNAVIIGCYDDDDNDYDDYARNDDDDANDLFLARFNARRSMDII